MAQVPTYNIYVRVEDDYDELMWELPEGSELCQNCDKTDMLFETKSVTKYCWWCQSKSPQSLLSLAATACAMLPNDQVDDYGLPAEMEALVHDHRSF